MAEDPLKPSVALLVKLSSLAVHIQELLSPEGHPYDRMAIETILNNPEVITWVVQMDAMGFVPKKR